MNKQFFKISILSILTASLGMVSSGCTGKDNIESHEEHDHDTHNDHVDEDPHETDAHDHSCMITLDLDKATEYGVETWKIVNADFYATIPVSGRIESMASDEAVATATRSGILTLSPNINTGMKIAAGSNIGSIRSTTVQGGDPTIMAAAARDAAKRELDRVTPLHKEGIVSTQVYNEALAAYHQAEAALKSTRQGSANVTSPKSGIITQLLAKSGEYVEIGQKIAVISGNTSLTLKADVPEKYWTQLSGIKTANFRPASSSETFSLEDLGGKIISKSGSAMSENGYIPVYFSFENNGTIAPGTFAEIYLISDVRKDVISVPIGALVEISGNKCIYTRHGNDNYEKHVVKTGATDGQRVEILSGLEPGENVVVKGAQIVRMAETSATAIPGHSHNH